jgi:hypothetical protein
MLTIMASVVRTALVLGPQKNSAQFAWNMLWGAVECSVGTVFPPFNLHPTSY